MARGLCNTKDRPPALALRDRSQQSVSAAKTRVLDSLCAFCASEPPPPQLELFDFVELGAGTQEVPMGDGTHLWKSDTASYCYPLEAADLL